MATPTKIPANDLYVGGYKVVDGDTGALFNSGSPVPPVVAGDVYYVDVNAGLDTYDGLTWATAFKTLAVAITASNASIAAGASGWAARNRIYFKGDNNEAHKETLITLPNKCDVIGVGSYDHRPNPVMIGNHVIGAGEYMGTRFINMGFMSLAAGGAIFTVPTTTSGLAFIGCHFDGRTAEPATYGVVATGVEQLSIVGCDFIGAYSAAAISIGAGSGRSLLIKDNIIESGAVGVLVSSSYTCASGGGIGKIIDNVFHVTTLAVNDASSKCVVGGNRGASLGDGQVTNILVYNDNLGYDNILAHSQGVSQYPVLVTIPTS